MSDLVTVQGVVLSSLPIGEYDRRIVLLTAERGKISAFARGARKPGSPFMAAVNPFVFGRFTLYEGRSSYNVNQVEITHQFIELAGCYPGIYYGYYFLELADYFGREGIDARESMNLLYLTAKALLLGSLDVRLIRCCYEMRTMAIQGLMPELSGCTVCHRTPEDMEKDESLFFSIREHGLICSRCKRAADGDRPLSHAAYLALCHMAASPLKRLYTFTLTEPVLREVMSHVFAYTAANTDKKFRSLAILESMSP